MKKKSLYTLFLIFISTLLLSCGENEIPISNEAEELPQYEDSFDTNVSDESDVNEEPITEEYHPTTFEMSSSDIAKIIYDKDTDSFSRNIKGYNIDVFPNGDYFLFCVTSKEESFPSLIYAYDQQLHGTKDSSLNLIQPFFDSIPKDYNAKIDSYNIGDSSREIISCIWIAGSEPGTLPVTIKLNPDTDYFLYANLEEYKLACTEGRYNDIFNDVQLYIDNTNPPDYDNAYTIQSVLSPIIEDWDSIEVQYDSVEKYATFFKSKVNSISNNIHFVPYATTNEKQIKALIGFYDSDWLFFKDIIISSDENIRISASKNKIEDVISGGKVYEAYNCYLDEKDIEELLSSSEHTIRFSAQNDNYKDYEMSDEEFEALVSIAKFYNVRNILSDRLYHFQSRQP